MDLMKYSDNRGANTISGARMHAPHMTMTSDPYRRVSGIAAFEILFHETSHHVFGFRHGYVAGLIRKAAENLGTPIPRDLWCRVVLYDRSRAR